MSTYPSVDVTAKPFGFGQGREHTRGDGIGVVASVLCAIHCAVTPLLLLFAPAFAEFWAHPASHWLVALFVVPLAVLMTIRGFRVHRKRWIVASGLVGVVLVIVGAIIPYWESRANANGGEGNFVEDGVAQMNSADSGAAVETPDSATDPDVSESVDDGDVFFWKAGEPMPDAECDSTDEVFVWNAGEPLPDSGEEEQCLDSCCPSLVTDSEGNTKLHISLASIVTTLGGFALICTHLGNLCACRQRRQTDCCHSTLC